MKSVRRYLFWAGFLQGSRIGPVDLNEDHKFKLAVYLSKIQKNRARPLHERLDEVHLDEFYVHHHYRGDEKSLHHPNESQYRQSKQPHEDLSFASYMQLQWMILEMLRFWCLTKGGIFARRILVEATTKTYAVTILSHGLLIIYCLTYTSFH